MPVRELAIESQVTMTARTRARENPKCYRPLYETAARSGVEILLQTTIRNSRAQRAKICYRTLCDTFHLFGKLELHASSVIFGRASGGKLALFEQASEAET